MSIGTTAVVKARQSIIDKVFSLPREARMDRVERRSLQKLVVRRGLSVLKRRARMKVAVQKHEFKIPFKWVLGSDRKAFFETALLSSLHERTRTDVPHDGRLFGRSFDFAEAISREIAGSRTWRNGYIDFERTVTGLFEVIAAGLVESGRPQFAISDRDGFLDGISRAIAFRVPLGFKFEKRLVDLIFLDLQHAVGPSGLSLRHGKVVRRDQCLQLVPSERPLKKIPPRPTSFVKAKVVRLSDI